MLYKAMPDRGGMDFWRDIYPHACHLAVLKHFASFLGSREFSSIWKNGQAWRRTGQVNGYQLPPVLFSEVDIDGTIWYDICIAGDGVTMPASTLKIE